MVLKKKVGYEMRYYFESKEGMTTVTDIDNNVLYKFRDTIANKRKIVVSIVERYDDFGMAPTKHNARGRYIKKSKRSDDRSINMVYRSDMTLHIPYI